ncbi:MAG: T9SS type A sorting domain-containing protein [Ignavibacteria bacterium]|nr:T9SS type A sorting domain-containing protein [Ignavibacteria bacterium]
MKNLILLLFVFVFALSVFPQVKIQEGFETADSLTPPAGWSIVNNAPFPIYPEGNWTVRDTGVAIPGISALTTKAHTGYKSVMTTWYAGIDTNPPNPYGTADAWLITKNAGSITTDDYLKFWAFGGSPSYSDSMQVWVSTLDSNTYSFLDKIASIHWPVGTTWGVWTQYSYSLAQFAGATNFYVAFRYYMDCSLNGFCVFVDDVFVGVPTSVTQIGNGVPTKFELKQNYPNPFNPVTNIRFDIPKTTDVRLVVYNSLGEEVKVLSEGVKSPGTYELRFDASNLSSGIYFYRLFAGNYIETKKMMVIK